LLPPSLANAATGPKAWREFCNKYIYNCTPLARYPATRPAPRLPRQHLPVDSRLIPTPSALHSTSTDSALSVLSVLAALPARVSRTARKTAHRPQASAMSSSCPHRKLASPTSARNELQNSVRAESSRGACKTELGIAQQRRARIKASAPEAARYSPTPAPSPIPPFGANLSPRRPGSSTLRRPVNWKQCQSAPGGWPELHRGPAGGGNTPMQVSGDALASSRPETSI
ncbi:hypothetical protein C8R43DRAFT_1145647, partial [Mycena crocata]